MIAPNIRKLASLIAAAALFAATPAMADSAAYFRAHALESDVPSLLSVEERDHYRLLFTAIRAEDWPRVQALLTERKSGPLQQVALAEFYLAARSPKVELPQIEEWLEQGTTLPQAEQLARMGERRGASNLPYLPREQTFYGQPAAPKRILPRSIDDGAMPGSVSSAILARIKADDPDGARQLLDGIDAALSAESRAEWRQKVAWSYYIENQDAAALAMAVQVSAGAGPWVAEGEWVAGLAAWRLGDCASALSSFEQSARKAVNPELASAAAYWASRAAVRCRQPQRVPDLLRQAARHDETLYGMLAAEQLGIDLPQRFAAPDFTAADWNRLKDQPNVQVAIQLTEVGELNLASEVLMHQARIGDPAQYESLSRLARCLGMPGTQLYMANNAPQGGQSDPAARYPTPKWTPVTGWKVDPALAYAHTLQESNFRVAVVSPAAAKGLMQITPITVRQHAPSLGMNAGGVDLTDPATNLAFGQRNLEMLRDSTATQGRLPKIMAAYNAGLTPITRWNSEVIDQGDPLLYMESIPYWETRGYVAIVMRNYWMYERQAGSDSPTRMALAQGQWPLFPGISTSYADNGLVPAIAR